MQTLRLTPLTVAIGLCGGLALSVGACNNDTREVEYQTLTQNEPLSWDEFKERSSVYGENGTLSFVIEGDIGVNEQMLRDYYDAHYVAYTDKSSVETSGGSDVVWSATDKLNVTYCVSDSFGNRKPRAIVNMREAVAAWMSAANVVYTYVPSEDAACADGYTGVKLNVLPQSSGGGLGCFPNACDHLLMNYDGYFQGYSWHGAWTHEVGHTLGLGHEHINPPCSYNPAGESVRIINSYDINSSLHYSVQCGSTSTGQLTATDKAGLATLYGAPSSSAITVLPNEWIRAMTNNLLI